MKNKVWILVVAAILVLGGGLYFWRGSKNTAITYREVRVEKGDITVSILSTGTVQPENRLEIKPPVAGRVEQVLIQEGQKVRKGQILVWMSSTERAALMDSARSKGPDEVKRWEDIYRPTPVVAPINGTIILRSVESGQTFTATDSILVMSDRLTVKAQVDETDIAQIKLKQSADIVLDAYSGDSVPGKVDQIAFEAKAVNNVTTYLVDVLPDATPEYMRSGMTANVAFDVDSKEDVLLVPNEALKSSPGAAEHTALVLVRGPNGKPVDREIKTGITDGKRTEVVAGLSEGDVVLSAQLGPRKSQANNPFSPMGKPRGR